MPAGGSLCLNTALIDSQNMTCPFLFVYGLAQGGLPLLNGTTTETREVLSPPPVFFPAT